MSTKVLPLRLKNGEIVIVAMIHDQNAVHPVVGIILAVPTTAVITIFVQDFYLLRRRK